jgi:hypothetical protein
MFGSTGVTGFAYEPGRFRRTLDSGILSWGEEILRCHVETEEVSPKAWPVEQAVVEILSLRGRQFDRAIVDAFGQFDVQTLADPQTLMPSPNLRNVASQSTGSFVKSPLPRV